MMDKRDIVRYVVGYPVSLRGELVDGGGVVIDVSPGGCRIRTAEAVQVGTYLRLILHPASDTEVIKAELAFVRWLQGDEIGVEFVRVNPEQREKLRHLLYLLRLGAGGRYGAATAKPPAAVRR